MDIFKDVVDVGRLAMAIPLVTILVQVLKQMSFMAKLHALVPVFAVVMAFVVVAAITLAQGTEMTQQMAGGWLIESLITGLSACGLWSLVGKPVAKKISS